MFLYLIFPEYYLGIFPGISKGTFSEYSRNIYWECSTNTPRTCICPVGFCLTFALIFNFYYNEYPLNMRLFLQFMKNFIPFHLVFSWIPNGCASLSSFLSYELTFVLEIPRFHFRIDRR